MAAGGDVPHDLATFVVERALGIEFGFWGCVAEGATFRTLGRKRTQPGRAVIRRHLEELDDAERRVNEAYFAWRNGKPTPAAASLDETLATWQSLPRGDEIVLEWATPSRRERRSSSDGPARARRS